MLIEFYKFNHYPQNHLFFEALYEQKNDLLILLFLLQCFLQNSIKILNYFLLWKI